jgi:hypothetical protein
MLIDPPLSCQLKYQMLLCGGFEHYALRQSTTTSSVLVLVGLARGNMSLMNSKISHKRPNLNPTAPA